MAAWVARYRAPAVMLAAILLAAGCGDTGRSVDRGKTPPDGKQKGHDHPDEGPHHGALVEWGDEEYHAEFTADRTKGEVTVYILGKDAKTAAPIKADKVQLTSSNPAFQLDLKPAPQPGDPPGTASRFTGTLPETAKGRRLSGTISGVVDGKPYAGDFRELPPHRD